MIKKRIASLIDVKSIVTLIMTVALIFLMCGSNQPSQEFTALFCTSYGSIMTYFFTKKGKDEKDE